MSIENYVCTRPHIGIGAIIIRDNTILMGNRIGAHGANTWSFPGGKLDYGETFFDCTRREVLEETGVHIKNLKLGPYTNDIFKEDNLHYVTLYIIADYKSGIAEVKETKKCLEWKWFEWNNLPEPLFLPIQNLLKQGFNPFEK